MIKQLEDCLHEGAAHAARKVQAGGSYIRLSGTVEEQTQDFPVQDTNIRSSLIPLQLFMNSIKDDSRWKIEEIAEGEEQLIRDPKLQNYDLIASAEATVKFVDQGEEAQAVVKFFVAKDWNEDRVGLGSDAFRSFALQQMELIIQKRIGYKSGAG